MFDRFTERARQVMTLARMEAQKLSNDYIGTEHILLGLVVEGSGVAAQVLKNLDVDLRKVRYEVERLVEQGNSPVSGSQLPFTPRAKRVLEFALEEAQNLGHNYIGTEHLLLGLIREHDGPAARVLQCLGVQPGEVREEIVDLLGADPPAGKEAPAPRPSGWAAVPPSPAVDWALVHRLRAEVDAGLRDRLEGLAARVYIELLPRKGDWRYRFSIAVFPPGDHLSSFILTVPGGRVKDMEKDLPGLVDEVVQSIRGGGKGGV